MKVILTEAAIQDLKKAGDSTYAFLMPTVQEIRYRNPEMLDYHMRSKTCFSWALGLMMYIFILKLDFRYEYMYGLHPFYNKDSKIMQLLIKKYPVVFPDSA